MSPIVESIQPVFSMKVWEDLTPQFYITFWSLQVGHAGGRAAGTICVPLPPSMIYLRVDPEFPPFALAYEYFHWPGLWFSSILFSSQLEYSTKKIY